MLGLPIVPEEDNVGLTNLEVGGLIPLGLVESGALIFFFLFSATYQNKTTKMSDKILLNSS